MSQKTQAVKHCELAYTSASSPENQNESEKAYANAPTMPAPITVRMAPSVSSPDFNAIFFPIAVMVQNKNNTANVFINADMQFSITDTSRTSPPEKSVNILPSIKNS